MLENVNKEEGEVAATEAEEAKGLLAQRVAAFEGEEKAPLQTGAAEWMKRGIYGAIATQIPPLFDADCCSIF